MCDALRLSPNTSYKDVASHQIGITSIDVSQEMLNQFHQKLPEIPLTLNLIHGDASQLPFADSSFDVVLTIHILHTVASVRTFPDEIDRVLKPNGFYLNAQWITPPARREVEPD